MGNTVGQIIPFPITRDQAVRLDSFARVAHADGENLVTVFDISHCGVWLRNGADIPCLAVYCDDLGNWTTLDGAGVVRQYLGSEVC